MFALVYGEHEGDWDATAAHIVALETKIAAAHWDVVKRRDADLTYNLRKFAELSRRQRVSTGRCGCTRWALILRPEGPLEVVVANPMRGRVRRAVGQRGHRGLAALAALAGDQRAGVAAVR